MLPGCVGSSLSLLLASGLPCVPNRPAVAVSTTQGRAVRAPGATLVICAPAAGMRPESGRSAANVHNFRVAAGE